LKRNPQTIQRLKDSFKGFSLTNYEDVGMGGVVFCFCVYLLILLTLPAEPPDDLLRHMKAYTYGYDYRLMFPSSPGMPAFDMYLLFDVAVGKIHALFGPQGFIAVQAVVFSVFGVAIFWLLRGATSMNLRFSLMMVTLALCFSRLLLARPSTLVSGLFLLAMAAADDERVRWWFHLLLGCLMASFYYLFWVYFIPLVFLRRIYAIPLVAGLVGWFMYGGSEYTRVLHEILTMKGRRGFEISEAKPIYYGLMIVCVVLIPVLHYWRCDIKRLIATGWFLLSNQTRYLEVVIPSALSYAKHWNVKLSQSVVVIIFITACCYRSYTKPPESWKVLKDVVPAGSRVLMLDMNTMFKAVYGNEGIGASPCMEPGWDTRELVKAMRDAQQYGRLNPDPFLLKPYDYVIENNLRESPPGFELVKLAGPYRVWKVPPQLRPLGKGAPL
jgi:hypothetical protein